MGLLKQNVRLISFLTFVFMAFTPFVALADCNFATDIKAMPDGSYSYSRDCHVEVGKRVKKLVIVEQQVVELEKTIELKDLALSKETERASLWMDTSYKLQDKLMSYQSASKASDRLYFITGVLVTVASVWAAGQLRH